MENITKLNYQKSDQIGVFIKLTNSFCLIPQNVPENLYKVLKYELSNKIPIILSSIIGSKCVGRLVIGNKRGIILPQQTTAEEYINLKNFLPENIIIKRCEEKFSALSNSVCTNDYISIVNPEINSQTIELISDTLGVEVFRTFIGKENLVGSYCVLNNNGGILCPYVTFEEQDELSSLLEIPLLVGTVNRGSKLISSGISTNDFNTFCGLSTSQSEIFIIKTALKKKLNY